MKSPRGNCYVACEALYHCLGGAASDWKPRVMRFHGDTHWFLRHASGLILDPTVSQFGGQVPHYGHSRGCGFLTRKPSRRAQQLMRVLVWQ